MLTRLNSNTFSNLMNSWAKQSASVGEDFGDYATPSIRLAKDVCDEDPPDKNYGIFALSDERGIVHVNSARLPKTRGKTLRVLWLLLAPSFDYEDITPQLIANIAAELIMGSYLLAKDPFKVQQVKIHLGSAVDRRYFTAIAVALASQKIFQNPEIRGQWLHFGVK